SFLPEIQMGRAPDAKGEVVLGPKTLDKIRKRVGDEVMVGTTGVRPTPMKIVGRAVLPTVGHTANLGEGALITFDSIGAFVPGTSAAELPRDAFLVRFHLGAQDAVARVRLAK